MTHGTARTAALLVGLLVLLARGAPGPGDLAAAGGASLVAYGALTLGGPMLRRLLTPPPPPEPVPEPTTPD